MSAKLFAPMLVASMAAAAGLAPASPSAHGAIDSRSPAVLRACADPTVLELAATGPTVGGGGTVELRMAGSPYGVAVASDGRYVTDVRVALRNLRPWPDRSYVVWATTPDLDEIAKIGVVDGAAGRVRGTVAWNQFLVFVTVERDPAVERWAGPIVFTAMSPSGKMHTKAGHGPFQAYSYLC